MPHDKMPVPHKNIHACLLEDAVHQLTVME